MLTIINFQQGIQFVDSIYLDSNVLCYARDRSSNKYQIASSILGELLAQNKQIFISELTIDEVWWALLRVWYEYDTGRKLNQGVIKNNRTILPTYYRKLKINTTKILQIPNLCVLPINNLGNNRIAEALNILTSHGLMPRDSFHLTLTKLNNIQGFITSDGDYDNLNLPFNLVLYKF